MLLYGFEKQIFKRIQFLSIKIDLFYLFYFSRKQALKTLCSKINTFKSFFCNSLR